MGTKMDVRPHTGFDGRYLGLTTFKRDGTGVTTPVWFVREAGGSWSRPTRSPTR